MYKDISTRRLLLQPIQTNEEGSVDLARFHALWSNDQATKWSLRGPCKTIAESKAWMAGIIPPPMPTNKIRIPYWVLYSERNGKLIQPLDVDQKEWKMAGIVTLLCTNFKLEGETDDCERGDNEPYKAVELGYLFMPEVWGKGVATESVQAIVDYYQELIHSNMPVEIPREVQATAHEKNIGSRRVLEKTGFKEVGRFEGQANLPLVEESLTHTAVHYRRL